MIDLYNYLLLCVSIQLSTIQTHLSPPGDVINAIHIMGMVVTFSIVFRGEELGCNGI